MQAYIRDLSSKQNFADDKSFQICQRVLHKCHEIIYEDIPGLVAGPYSSSMRIHSRAQSSRKQVKHHAEPAIVGIGCILASVPGMPSFCDVYGQVAIEQGRKEDSPLDSRGLVEGGENSIPTGIGPTSPEASGEDVDDGDNLDDDAVDPPTDDGPSVSRLFFAVIPPPGDTDSQFNRGSTLR